MQPAYGVQFHGSEHVIRTASFLAFHFTHKTWQRYWWSWNFGFLKVIQTSSQTSHKIQIILAILMVVFTFLYLLWGTRTGTCCVFVYLFFLGNPLGVLGHIIHHWKGIHEDIAAPLELQETVQQWWRNSRNKFGKCGSQGGIDSRSLSRPPGGLNCDVRLPETLPQTL